MCALAQRYVIFKKRDVMFDTRPTYRLLIGLVFLLGIQLTGLTCLGEWPLGPATAQAEMTADSPLTPENLIADGCPCHVVFQSVCLVAPEVLSPRTDDVDSTPSLYVPTFVVVLFHPPLTV